LYLVRAATQSNSELSEKIVLPVQSVTGVVTADHSVCAGNFHCDVHGSRPVTGVCQFHDEHFWTWHGSTRCRSAKAVAEVGEGLGTCVALSQLPSHDRVFVESALTRKVDELVD
jgi:hypothetical protein